MTETSDDTAMARGCVLVLGMHRSGTSALAGMLSLLGCATPATLIRGDENNEKGYFESNAIGRLSDAILDEMGSAWSDWTPLDLSSPPSGSRQALRKRIEDTISKDFSDAPLFVLKEPRMCRMIPLWLEAFESLGCDAHIVHTHRNPEEVVASLERRDGFDPAFSRLLWLRHVLEAESATRGLPRVFTSYRHLMQDWRQVAKAMDDRFHLTLSDADAASEVDGFLSGKLRHFEGDTADTLANDALPKNIRAAFGAMERWAEDGESSADYQELDDLRADLNNMSAALKTLVRPGQMAMLALPEKETEIQVLKGDLENAAGREQALQADLSSKEEETLRLRADLTGKEGDILRLTADLAGKEDKMLDLSAGLAKKEDAILQLQATLDELEARMRDLGAELADKEDEARRLQTALAAKEAKIAELKDRIGKQDLNLRLNAQTLDRLRATMARQLH